MCGAPAAFAGDKLEMVGFAGVWAHEQGLNHAMLFEACREFGEFGFGEIAAGLPGVGMDMFNGNDAVGSIGGGACAIAACAIAL